MFNKLLNNIIFFCVNVIYFKFINHIIRLYAKIKVIIRNIYYNYKYVNYKIVYNRRDNNYLLKIDDDKKIYYLCYRIEIANNYTYEPINKKTFETLNLNVFCGRLIYDDKRLMILKKKLNKFYIFDNKLFAAYELIK